jgi:hypothetical protein
VTANEAIKKIVEATASLPVYEKRAKDDNYYEIVFMKEDLDKWEKCLTEIIGVPAKPQKAKPTKEDLRATECYGGIQSEQTLFRKTFDNGTVIAMFWPWQDKAHITLKVAFA